MINRPSLRARRALARSVAPLLLAPSLLVLGCGDDRPSPGMLEVRIYGEAFIEEGIPAPEIADGWAVKFESFLVSLTQVSVARGHGAAALDESNQRLFDLARPSATKGISVASKMVEGGRYDHVEYVVGPAKAGALAGNALPAGTLEAMIAGGESVRVAGSGTKDGKTVRFAWGFTGNTEHSCHVGLEVDGRTTASEITIHGDHLFYDDLVSMDPDVRFDLVAAADADMDGNVTQAELAAKDIRGQARYQVGNIPATNLWAFIAHQATTVGHINGEGHCATTAK